MGSSLRGRMMLWLATFLLLFLSRSINNQYRNDKFVDASIHDVSFSISSQYHHRRGFGLPNRSKQHQHQHQHQYHNPRRGWRWKQQQEQQQTELKKRRRPKFPWLLPHYSRKLEKESDAFSAHYSPIVPWRIATASLLKLRGGSNENEHGSSSISSRSKPKDTNGSKHKRSSKSKTKLKSKTKHKDKDKPNSKHNNSKNKRKPSGDGETIDDKSDDENDDDADDVDDIEDLLDGEKVPVTTTESSEKDEPPSKMFLIDPFRMNEMARYEASLMEDPPNKTITDERISEESAATLESDDEEDGVINSDSGAHKTKGKKKRDSAKAKPTTTTTGTSASTSGESSVGVEETEIHTDGGGSVAAGKEKKRQPQKGKRGRTEGNASGEENRKGVETTVTTEEENNLEHLEGETVGGDIVDGPSNDDTATPTDHSNFWWLDVWTQQLSDPEDLEDLEEDSGGESYPNDINALLDGDAIHTNATAKERENQIHDNKYEKDQVLPSQIEESLELPVNADFNHTLSTDSDSLAKADETDNATQLSENETSARDTDSNATATILESSESIVSYESTGAWFLIDNLITIGLASRFTSLRVSRKLRRIRKLSARITRLHGLLSGKPYPSVSQPSTALALDLLNETASNGTAAGAEKSTIMDEETMEDIQKRIAAIDRAREGVKRAQEEEKAKERKRSFWGFKPKNDDEVPLDSNETKAFDEEATEDEDVPEVIEEPKISPKSPEEIEEEFQRMERVREIDRLISDGQKLLADLVCEKDVLQRRPNPLFNYTTTETIIVTEHATTDDVTTDETKKISASPVNATSKVEIQATREMNFPPDDLVAEYLDMMLSTRRLTKMNHTDLWKESEDDGDEEEEEESIGDDLFTASADAHRLYQDSPSMKNRNGKKKSGKKSGGGGSWLLRQSIGRSKSLGEKIGETAEIAAYKAVATSLMSILVRSISSLHGINVMKHSDICLFLEQSPDLPPVLKDGIIRGDHSNYAEETIKTVMRRKTRRSKKRSSKHRFPEASSVQQELVTDTLLSHVQISAPLLKLFPLAWQRALLGNIISLSCALISDFLDGLHFQILGHQLTFAFRPITEVDMARHFLLAGDRFSQRRSKAAEFEAAVQATAEDLKEELKFLDGWHERALGSGVLRAQIANMIARIVLTLTDEVLSGARMDLWLVQASGPRMMAGLEHRIEEDDDEDE